MGNDFRQLGFVNAHYTSTLLLTFSTRWLMTTNRLGFFTLYKEELIA